MNTPSYARGTAEPPLIERTIGDHFDAVADRQPDAAALISRHEGRRLSYRELQTLSRRLASGLLRAGLQPGDRIGIWSHNNVAWILMQIATARIGLVLVNVNPAYRTSELGYALEKVGCKALVTMARFKSSDYLGMLGHIGAVRQQLQHVWWIDRPDEDLQEAHAAQAERFSSLLGAGDPDDPRVASVQRTLDARDPVNIQFTSGTTGSPKGATLTHRNVLNNGFFVGECMRLTPADRLCVPVPMYHCFGMVLGSLAALTHGSAIVFASEAFDAQAVLEAVHIERCTALHGVPTMFIALLNHPLFDTFDLGSLRTGIMAGTPCPIEVMRKVVEKMHLPQITIAYGMTETSPVSCQSTVDTPLERRVGTVGLVQPHLEIKIVHPDTGDTVARGERGEFCTRGYSVMRGYWDDEAKTREAVDEDGWMHTGDLATIDDEGYVNIVGRIKDMVIRGGENIYPREIEEFLHQHPGIQDVQVVGIPDARYGEELCAWIIAAPGAQVSEEDVRAFCKDRIAHYKVPAHIRFVAEFPTTVTGKIQKFRIRELMCDALGLTENETA